MKITFLGTAAAPGIPMPYCNCETCKHARRFHGKNMRKRCAYLINKDLLVDMGPDLFTACAIHNVDLLQMKYTLITHSHLDHIFVQNLGMRAQGLHRETEIPSMTLVAPPSVMTMLNAYGGPDDKMNLTRYPIHPYDHVELPDYHVKSIKATHFPAVGDAVNYLIDDGKKKVFIASDTAIYEEAAWTHLENKQLDLLVIECTKGFRTDSSPVHLNVTDMQTMISRMKEIHAVTADTTIYATHFSHQHCPPHEELQGALEAIGVHCAYDGLVLEV